MATIRPAVEADQPIIEHLVKVGHVANFRLLWQNFMLAEQDGEVVGIGQIRWHNGLPELASIAVAPDYRGQGIAAQVINALEARAGPPMYLYCRGEMGTFYQRLGYQRVRYWQVPNPLKPFTLLPFTLSRLRGVKVIMMCKDHPQ